MGLSDSILQKQQINTYTTMKLLSIRSLAAAALLLITPNLSAVTAPLEDGGNSDAGCIQCTTLKAWDVQGPVVTGVCHTYLDGILVDTDTKDYNKWTDSYEAQDACIPDLPSSEIDCIAGGGGASKISRVNRWHTCECNGITLPNGLCLGFFVVTVHTGAPVLRPGPAKDKCIEC